jgi:hypothetical protein
MAEQVAAPAMRLADRAAESSLVAGPPFPIRAMFKITFEEISSERAKTRSTHFDCR